jgi:hypothetical protein
VIDAHAVHLPFAEQAQDQPVGGRKHLGGIHVQRGQLINIEEPPRVDFFRGHTPVTEAIGLLPQQCVQQVKTVRVARRSVEQGDVHFDECA